MKLQIFTLALTLALVAQGEPLTPPHIGAAVNADETLLVTTRNRTATIWHLANGEKQHEMTPPPAWGIPRLGESIQDALFDPQNRWLLIWSDTLYFHDINSGTLQRKIETGAAPSGMGKLCLSPDRAWLAGAHRKFLRRIADGEPAPFFGNDYHRDIVTDCAFTPDNHLLALSFAGVHGRPDSLRLHQTDGTIAAEIHPAGSTGALALHPDGQRFALSAWRAINQENVIHLGTIRPLHISQTLPAGHPGEDTALVSLAWSADGTTLYAGGTHHDADGNYPLILLQADNPAAPRYLKAGTAWIQKIIPLKNGRIIVATANEWLLMDENGTIEQRHHIAPPERPVDISRTRCF
ncbi:MAG: WD40 repeat domain-containing protein [Cardiobacterium sp.]